MKTKPIMIAGKQRPFFNHKKIGTAPLPQIYLWSRLSSLYSLSCLSRDDLTPLWTKTPFATRTTLAEHLNIFNPSFCRIYNNDILAGAFATELDGGGDLTDHYTTFDLAFQQKDMVRRIPSPYNLLHREIIDIVKTSDGYVFFMYKVAVEYGGELSWKVYVYCHKKGVQQGSPLIFPEHFLDMRAMVGSLEYDGVFRLYFIGAIHDPIYTPEAERYCDIIWRYRYDFVNTTFVKDTEHSTGRAYIDTDQDAADANRDAEHWRGYQLFVPTPTAATIKTIYYVSMIAEMTEPIGDSKQTARIGVIKDTTRTFVQDVHLANGIGYYTDGCEYTFLGLANWGLREVLECALLYRNRVHYLYFRVSTDLKPAVVYRMNMRTGVIQELSAFSWEAGEKPHLMGVSNSVSTPNEFDTIFMVDRERARLFNVDDLINPIASVNVADVMVTYGNTLMLPRINRQLHSR